VFGSGSDRHVAYWESIKVVDRVEEDAEDEKTMVIHEKERFSQRLTLLYADGRIALLSEKSSRSGVKEQEHEKCAPPDGQTDLHLPDG